MSHGIECTAFQLNQIQNKYRRMKAMGHRNPKQPSQKEAQPQLYTNFQPAHAKDTWHELRNLTGRLKYKTKIWSTEAENGIPKRKLERRPTRAPPQLFTNFHQLTPRSHGTNCVTSPTDSNTKPNPRRSAMEHRSQEGTFKKKAGTKSKTSPDTAPHPLYQLTPRSHVVNCAISLADSNTKQKSGVLKSGAEFQEESRNEPRHSSSPASTTPRPHDIINHATTPANLNTKQNSLGDNNGASKPEKNFPKIETKTETSPATALHQHPLAHAKATWHQLRNISKYPSRFFQNREWSAEAQKTNPKGNRNGHRNEPRTQLTPRTHGIHRATSPADSKRDKKSQRTTMGHRALERNAEKDAETKTGTIPTTDPQVPSSRVKAA
ncbi:hypothetical protein B0J18DRAFT_219834 [Chaetomium sp. MPI-SDFR-AT-0129]|nr:hypothetical protein B0J18DRAFT_219834 [Chaetomium sp. MPI-SDFR-AT-0129]